MVTILLYSFKRLRGQMLGWGIALAVLGAYLVGFYDTLFEQQEELVALVQNYPPELMAMFGDFSRMFTPAGYLQIEFFSYMPLVLGIFAILTGSGLLAGDEENGALDLVLAHPVSRIALFLGRLAAFLLAVLGILVLICLGFLVAIPGSGLGISLREISQAGLSLFAILAFFGTLAIFFSMVLPSRRLAAMASGLLLVASFFITTLERLDDSLSGIARFSPLNYYQGADAIEGMNWTWLAALLGFAALFALLAVWRFERRDIRVGGEGGWRILGLVPFRKKTGEIP